MKAMVLRKICRLEENPAPLELRDIPCPSPGDDEVLIKVTTCGVCHTELDEIEGRTAPPVLPVIPGHQVVGRIVEVSKNVTGYDTGDRVGVAWIFSACGRCKFCMSGQENLCPGFTATGRDANGGYAQYMVAPGKYAFKVPEVFTDMEAAPLLCAGAIGYRSLKLTGMEDGYNLGLTGFGASGHIVLKLSRYMYPNTKLFVFARSKTEREFAIELGASWAGDTNDESPVKLDCIIDTTPAWKPIVEALKNLEKGGRLVINAIRKENYDKGCLLNLDYSIHLWLEKEIKSVANIGRNDVKEFLDLAAEIPLKPEFQEYSLEEANVALLELKKKKIKGAKVLRIN